MENRRKFIKSTLLAAIALPTAFSFSATAAQGSPATYTVKKGDTLSGISTRFGISISELRRINNLSGDRIDAGQILKIKPHENPAQIYIVKSGDTLGQIALDHKISISTLKTRNRLTGDRIYPGQKLIISGSTPQSSRQYIADVIRKTEARKSYLRSWQQIVIHHSGVNNGNAKSYDRFHREQMRMPNGLAYHFVIGNGIDSKDGQIEIGSRWLKQLQGGHVKNYRTNETAIGICLVGNFETRHPTPRQLAALTELISYLKNDLLGGRPKVMVHREVDGNRTLCPGRNFPTAQIRNLFP